MCWFSFNNRGAGFSQGRKLPSSINSPFDESLRLPLGTAPPSQGHTGIPTVVAQVLNAPHRVQEREQNLQLICFSSPDMFFFFSHTASPLFFLQIIFMPSVSGRQIPNSVLGSEVPTDENPDPTQHGLYLRSQHGPSILGQSKDCCGFAQFSRPAVLNPGAH